MKITTDPTAGPDARNALCEFERRWKGKLGRPGRRNAVEKRYLENHGRVIRALSSIGISMERWPTETSANSRESFAIGEIAKKLEEAAGLSSEV